MGLFDFLKKGSNPPPPNKPQLSKKVAGPAKTVADKRAQTYDRAEAIRVLADMKTAEAAEALLKRFNFSIDPSITDQEEKESAFLGIVSCGEEAVPAVVEFCEKAEVLTWPLRILREVLGDAEYKAELLALAEGYDTEYARNVEPKLQVIGALGELRGEDVRGAVERFLEDTNENVRFTAVQSTFAQESEASIAPLLTLLEQEESIRIKNTVCAGFVSKGWKVPEALVDRAKQALGDVEDYGLSKDGSFRQAGGFSMA
jgi:HEAT repeat protein